MREPCFFLFAFLIYSLNMKEGEARGRAEGLAEGEARGKAEVAKAMLQNGLSVEMVMSCTGLSKKEVEALMN